MLVVGSGAGSCAVAGADVVAIDHDGDAARIAIVEPARALADFLPPSTTTSDASAPMRLVVQVAGRRYGFRTCAEIELVESATLYHLPRLVHELGCAPWISGVVLLEPNHLKPDDEPRLMVWIDLVGLVTATHQEIDR